jgi:hypothetical protein
MKKYLILLFVVLFRDGVSQPVSIIGFYQNGSFFVNIISDSTLEFRSEYGYCLVQEICGCGTYHVEKNEIWVHTKNQLVGETEDCHLVSCKVISDREIFFTINPYTKSFISGPYFECSRDRKKAQLKAHLKTIFTVWPWRWSFKSSCEPIDNVFTKK